jgi:hypothetical protein
MPPPQGTCHTRTRADWNRRSRRERESALTRFGTGRSMAEVGRSRSRRRQDGQFYQEFGALCVFGMRADRHDTAGAELGCEDRRGSDHGSALRCVVRNLVAKMHQRDRQWQIVPLGAEEDRTTGKQDVDRIGAVAENGPKGSGSSQQERSLKMPTWSGRTTVADFASNCTSSRASAPGAGQRALAARLKSCDSAALKGSTVGGWGGWSARDG